MKRENTEQGTLSSFSIGTRLTDPVSASIINAVEPILNPILVAVFYGELPALLSLFGAAVVIGSILFYNLRSLSQAPAWCAYNRSRASRECRPD